MFDTHHHIHCRLPICNAHRPHQHLALIKMQLAIIIVVMINNKYSLYLVFGSWCHSFAGYEQLVKCLIVVKCWWGLCLVSWLNQHGLLDSRNSLQNSNQSNSNHQNWNNYDGTEINIKLFVDLTLPQMISQFQGYNCRSSLLHSSPQWY